MHIRSVTIPGDPTCPGVELQPDPGGNVQPAFDLEVAIAAGDAATLTSLLAQIRSLGPEFYRASVRAFITRQLHRQSRLERHLRFFDADSDNLLTCRESRRGMRNMGFSEFMAGFVAFFAHLTMGPKTGAGFKIDLSRVHRAQHPDQHSGAFDADLTASEFQHRLDDIMAFADTNGRLDKTALRAYVRASTRAAHARVRGSDMGAGAKLATHARINSASAGNRLEFDGLFTVAASDTVDRADLDDFYNGVLFYLHLSPAELAARLIAMAGCDKQATQALAGPQTAAPALRRPMASGVSLWRAG